MMVTSGRTAAAELLGRMEARFREVLKQFAKELADADLGDSFGAMPKPLLEVREDNLRCVVLPCPENQADTKRLTRREREIALLVVRAFSNSEIGYRLGIKGPTVAAHLRRIYNKVGVDSRTALATYMIGWKC